MEAKRSLEGSPSNISLPAPCHQKPVSPTVDVPQENLPTTLSRHIDQPSACLSPCRQNSLAALLVFTNAVPIFSFGVGIGGGLQIASTLGVTETARASWIAASYPLTAGAFILCSGPLGAIYGHKRVLMLGAIWWIVCSFVTGFCSNFLTFNVMRGLSGIGSAMIVPNAVAIVGTTFPPGKMRNRCLGLFGAGAPIGGWSGALMAGLLAEKTPFKWLFVFMSLLGLVVFGSLMLVLPREVPVGRDARMDWLGSFLGITALIIFNFIWNQAPAVGWSSPCEIALLILAILLLVFFGVWELKYAANPMMPLNIWRAPSFSPVIIVVMLSFMSYGTFIWYLVAWQQKIRYWTVLSTAVGLIPLPIFSAGGAFIAAWLIPRLAVQWILVIGALAVMVAEVLVVTMPEQQMYWIQVFPATVIQSFCPDFVYTAAQIVACNNVGREYQGVAGSLIGTLQLYATSVGLAFAGIVGKHADPAGTSLTTEYRAALYFAIGLAIVALAVGASFVRMPKDTRQGWQDERDLPEVGVIKDNNQPLV